jgi:hypothetical protein
MIKNFTPDHLVSFLYHETTPNENAQINNALSMDATLNAEYNTLKEAHTALPKVQFRPSHAAIQNILNYSKKSEVFV